MTTDFQCRVSATRMKLTVLLALAIEVAAGHAAAATSASSAREAASSAAVALAAAASATAAGERAASAAAVLELATHKTVQSDAAAASAAEAATAMATVVAQNTRMHGLLITWAAIVAGALAFGALLLGLLAVLQARGRGHLRIRSHWGGFGGSGTGWEAEPAVVSFAVAGLFSLVATAIVAGLIQDTDARPPARNDEAPAAAKPASQAH